MTWRRAILYWGCFAVLAAYYLVAERRPAGEVAAHLARAPFLSLAEGEIDAVELRRDEARVRCRHIDQRWQVVEPAGRTVPSDLVGALVANLIQLPDVEVVAETSANLAQFGLDTPASQIVLTTSGGPSITVRLGSRNPAGTAVYAQRSDSGRVYLIGLNVRYYEDLVFEALRPAA
jgi:uncharacterized protein DUF4340